MARHPQGSSGDRHSARIDLRQRLSDHRPDPRAHARAARGVRGDRRVRTGVADRDRRSPRRQGRRADARRRQPRSDHAQAGPGWRLGDRGGVRDLGRALRADHGSVRRQLRRIGFGSGRARPGVRGDRRDRRDRGLSRVRRARLARADGAWRGARAGADPRRRLRRLRRGPGVRRRPDAAAESRHRIRERPPRPRRNRDRRAGLRDGSLSAGGVRPADADLGVEAARRRCRRRSTSASSRSRPR